MNIVYICRGRSLGEPVQDTVVWPAIISVIMFNAELRLGMRFTAELSPAN
jgi:hypothetical protein